MDKPPFYYASLVRETLKQPDAFGPDLPSPVDIEVIPNLSGSPDRIQVWLIFDTRQQADEGRRGIQNYAHRASVLLVGAGFPGDAIASLGLMSTSTEEIEEAGGRFPFFR